MNEKCFYPMLAHDTTAQNSESTLNRWSVFDTLSQRAQDLLTAPQTVALIKSFTQRLQIPASTIAQFSVAVRQLLFDEIDQATFIQQVSKIQGVQNNYVTLFLEHLFAIKAVSEQTQETTVEIDYRTAQPAEIAKHITQQSMMNATSKSSLLKRLISPHFANALLGCVATDYDDKLEFVYSLYTQANE